MNYLITGGAGFIGSSLANYLISNGHKVTVIDDLSMGKKENLNLDKVQYINGNVCDTNLMSKVLLEEQFDYIFLMAAIASVADSVARPLETHDVNFKSILTTLNIIKDTQKNIKRVVFTSSAAVYGDEPTLPKKEESVIRPLTPYAIDKFAAEKYILAFNNLYDVPTSAVRFFNVYGMNQNPQSEYSGVLSILSEQFRHLYNGEEASFTIFGSGKQSRDFIFIKDVINALTIVAESERSLGEVYNVGTGKTVSLLEVIATFESIVNKKMPVTHVEPRDGDIPDSQADITKLSSLGYRPAYSIENGIKEYFDYLVSGENDSIG